MNRLIFIILLAVGSQAALSQETRYGSFHLSAEPFLFQGKELLINGTTHNNLGYGFTADWRRVAPENYQEAGLGLDWVRPKSPEEPAPVTVFFNLNLHYALLYPVVDRNGWILYAGGFAEADLRTFFYALWDDSHMYWATFSGVGAQLLTRKQMGERKVFFAGLNLPLLGILSRPPVYRDNKMDDSSFDQIVARSFQDPELAHISNYFNPDITAGFELLISGKFSLAFFLHFEYLAAAASYSESYREMRKGLGIDFIF